jgi:LPXTG-motif cell wall-anchored protein
MKKNTILIIGGLAAAGALLYLLSKRKRGTVIVEDAIPITAEEYEANLKRGAMNEPVVQEEKTPLEKAVNIVSKIFPKRTAEQKQQRKTARTERKAKRKQKRSQAIGDFF